MFELNIPKPENFFLMRPALKTLFLLPSPRMTNCPLTVVGTLRSPGVSIHLSSLYQAKSMDFRCGPRSPSGRNDRKRCSRDEAHATKSSCCPEYYSLCCI